MGMSSWFSTGQSLYTSNINSYQQGKAGPVFQMKDLDEGSPITQKSVNFIEPFGRKWSFCTEGLTTTTSHLSPPEKCVAMAQNFGRTIFLVSETSENAILTCFHARNLILNLDLSGKSVLAQYE
jgi:hypothetical protein